MRNKNIKITIFQEKEPPLIDLAAPEEKEIAQTNTINTK
jgi:hypothetical protein